MAYYGACGTVFHTHSMSTLRVQAACCPFVGALIRWRYQHHLVACPHLWHLEQDEGDNCLGIAARHIFPFHFWCYRYVFSIDRALSITACSLTTQLPPMRWDHTMYHINSGTALRVLRVLLIAEVLKAQILRVLAVVLGRMSSTQARVQFPQHRSPKYHIHIYLKHRH